MADTRTRRDFLRGIARTTGRYGVSVLVVQAAQAASGKKTVTRLQEVCAAHHAGLTISGLLRAVGYELVWDPRYAEVARGAEKDRRSLVADELRAHRYHLFAYVNGVPLQTIAERVGVPAVHLGNFTPTVGDTITLVRARYKSSLA